MVHSLMVTAVIMPVKSSIPAAVTTHPPPTVTASATQSFTVRGLNGSRAITF